MTPLRFSEDAKFERKRFSGEARIDDGFENGAFSQN